jgi:hypothetical protein
MRWLSAMHVLCCAWTRLGTGWEWAVYELVWVWAGLELGGVGHWLGICCVGRGLCMVWSDGLAEEGLNLFLTGQGLVFTSAVVGKGWARHDLGWTWAVHGMGRSRHGLVMEWAGLGKGCTWHGLGWSGAGLGILWAGHGLEMS